MKNLGKALTKEEQKNINGGTGVDPAIFNCVQRSQLSFGGVSIVFYDCWCNDADGKCTGLSINGGPIEWDGEWTA